MMILPLLVLAACFVAAFLVLAGVVVGFAAPIPRLLQAEAVLALSVAVLALLERIPEHVRILVRLASAALMLSVAAFGMLAPWAICRSPPYGTRMCTPDDDERRELQRWRLKTAAWLAVVAAVLLALPASPLRDTYRFIKRTAGRMLV